jgi:hypothetical protein
MDTDGPDGVEKATVFAAFESHLQVVDCLSEILTFNPCESVFIRGSAAVSLRINPAAPAVEMAETFSVAQSRVIVCQFLQSHRR